MNEISKLNSHPIELLDPETTTSIENNELQMQREKINQFIQDNYRVFISNVDHLDEAQVICLGETHGNEWHREINGQIVDMLYRKNSILFVEEARADTDEESSPLIKRELKNEQAKYVKNPIEIKGWDIEEDENKRKEIKEFVIASMIYEKPKVAHFLSQSKMDNFNKDLENNQLSTYSWIKTISSFFCTMCCTALFIKSCKPCIKKYYGNKATQGFQKIINDVPVRNQSMCKLTQRAIKTYERIFVMGGSNHFDFVEQGEGVEGIDYGPSNYAIEQTINFLATTKFAILIPKSNDEIYF